MDMNLSFFALCIFAKALSAGAKEPNGPRNIACLSGTKVIITCEVPENNYIDWYHQRSNISVPRVLTNNTGSNISTNYLMIKVKNEESLVINSVQLRDAGVYYCITINSNGVSKEVGSHLIVLDSDPICDVQNVTVMEYDYIRLRCSVTYSGLWRPVMEWTQLGFFGQEKINNDCILLNITESHQYARMTVSLQILAKPYHNSSSFVCNTYFDYSDMLVKQKVNNNTPDYKHIWISTKINILYGPRNVSIYPASDIFYPGDKLSCYAMGNPKPEYKWTDNETVYSNVGSQIQIVQSMIRNQPYVLRCEARNSLSESFAIITFEVKNRSSVPIGIPISVAILIFLLIVTIFSVCRYYSRGPCVQRIRADRVLAIEHSEVEMASAMPNFIVEPMNEGVSSAVYEEIEDINISTRYQQVEESSTDYMELRERNLMQTVYERLHAL